MCGLGTHHFLHHNNRIMWLMVDSCTFLRSYPCITIVAVTVMQDLVFYLKCRLVVPELTVEEDADEVGLLFVVKDSLYSATLQTREFIGISEQASGRYTCRANNTIETSEAAVTVIVEGMLTWYLLIATLFET